MSTTSRYLYEQQDSYDSKFVPIYEHEEHSIPHNIDNSILFQPNTLTKSHNDNPYRNVAAAFPPLDNDGTEFYASFPPIQSEPPSPLMATPSSLSSLTASPAHRTIKTKEFDHQELARALRDEKLSQRELRILANQMQTISSSAAAEVRRQLHIQSEQRRRAQIRGGFDELRFEIPACADKKMSKAVLLDRAIEYIRKLKSERETLLLELERMKNVKK